VPFDLDDLQERAQEIARKFSFAEDHRFSIASRCADDDEDQSPNFKTGPSLSRRNDLRRSASLSRLPREPSSAQRFKSRDGIIWDRQIHGKEHAYILSVISEPFPRAIRSIEKSHVKDPACDHVSHIGTGDQLRNDDQERKAKSSFRRSLSLKSTSEQSVRQSAGTNSNDSFALREQPGISNQALGSSNSLIHRSSFTSQGRQADIRFRSQDNSLMTVDVSQQNVHPAFRQQPQDHVRIENRNGDIFLVHEYGSPAAYRVDDDKPGIAKAHQPRLSLNTDVPAVERKDTLSPILGCKIPAIEMFGPLLDVSRDRSGSSSPTNEAPGHNEAIRRGHNPLHEAFSPSNSGIQGTRRKTSRPDTPMTSSSAVDYPHYTYEKFAAAGYVPIFESPRTAPRPTGIASPPSTPPTIPATRPEEVRNSAYSSSHLESSPTSEATFQVQIESSYTSPRTMRSPPPTRRLRSSSSAGRCEALSTIIESRYEHSSAFQGLNDSMPRPMLVKSYTLPLCRTPSRPRAGVVGSPTRERGVGGGRSSGLKNASRRSGVIFDNLVGSPFI
jgi:hypothetical protein